MLMEQSNFTIHLPEPYFIPTLHSCQVHSLANANLRNQIAWDFSGRKVVDGTIVCDVPDDAKRFAEQIPFVRCVVDENELRFSYLQPDNGVIEFITSPQEMWTVNIRIMDTMWGEHPERQYLYIPSITQHSIYRWDEYSWCVDIQHKNDELMHSRLTECQYVNTILECGQYVTPDTERTSFLIANGMQRSFQRLYLSTGFGYGQNLMAYPVREIIK